MHPDHNKSPQASRDFQQLVLAHETLSDPQSRSAYDRTLRADRVRTKQTRMARKGDPKKAQANVAKVVQQFETGFTNELEIMDGFQGAAVGLWVYMVQLMRLTHPQVGLSTYLLALTTSFLMGLIFFTIYSQSLGKDKNTSFAEGLSMVLFLAGSFIGFALPFWIEGLEDMGQGHGGVLFSAFLGGLLGGGLGRTGNFVYGPWVGLAFSLVPAVILSSGFGLILSILITLNQSSTNWGSLIVEASVVGGVLGAALGSFRGLNPPLYRFLNWISDRLRT